MGNNWQIFTFFEQLRRRSLEWIYETHIFARLPCTRVLTITENLCIVNYISIFEALCFLHALHERVLSSKFDCSF